MPSQGSAAFGTLIKVSDGSSTPTFSTIGEVTNIDGPEESVDTLDITNHSSTGAHEEIVPSFIRSPEFTIDFNYLPGEATQGSTAGLKNLLDNRTKRAFKIEYPTTDITANNVLNFDAYVVGYSRSAPHDGVLSGSATLKPTGDITENSS